MMRLATGSSGGMMTLSIMLKPTLLVASVGKGPDEEGMEGKDRVGVLLDAAVDCRLESWSRRRRT
jgi:hypothetical protein